MRFFASIVLDGSMVDFYGSAQDIHIRALTYGNAHGWPSWNLFDEVDLPTYGL